jgi:SAM-dependent methyltransferase
MLAQLESIRDRVLDAAEIRPGETVADVGTGLGLLAIGAVERVGPDGEVLAIDVSVDCLEELERTVRAPTLDFLLGAAEVLPLPDESVDVVVARSVLMYVREREEAAREFFRVLRPGGRVSIFEPVNRRVQSLADAVDFGEDAQLVRDSEVARLEEDDPMHGFDEHDLEQAFRGAGFPGVRVEVEMLEWVFPAQALLTMSSAPGRQPLLERWRAEYGDEPAERLAARVRARGSTITVRLPAVYLAARKP